MGDLLQLGTVASRLGVATWKVQRLYDMGLVPAPNVHRAGRYRVVYESELPAIRKALEDAGYLLAQGPAIAG